VRVFSIDKALRTGNGSDPALSAQNGIYRQLQAHQQVSTAALFNYESIRYDTVLKS